MTGEPSGKWMMPRRRHLQKYHAVHGWQSKTVPDSRALIKLGLGRIPRSSADPESAMTTSPDGPHHASTPGGSPASSGSREAP